MRSTEDVILIIGYLNNKRFGYLVFTPNDLYKASKMTY